MKRANLAFALTKIPDAFKAKLVLVRVIPSLPISLGNALRQTCLPEQSPGRHAFTAIGERLRDDGRDTGLADLLVEARELR